MYIQAEISYSPFYEDYEDKITIFLEQLKKYEDVKVEVQPMSTLVGGEAKDIFQLLENEITKVFNAHQAIFSIRISNACPEECEI